MLRSSTLSLLFAGWAVALLPTAAGAADLSTRFALGGGARFEGAPGRPALDLAVRADLLLPRTVRDYWGIGPSLELRTTGFDALDLAGGFSLFAPMGYYFGLSVSAGVGQSFAGPGRGLHSFTQLGWGMRGPIATEPYGSSQPVRHSLYSTGGGLYVRYARSLNLEDRSVLSAGIELDPAAVVGMVEMISWLLTSAGRN